MNRTPHVVALCGSLRDESKTRVALDVALDGVRDTGATTTLVDLRTFDLPPVDADDMDAGDAPELRGVVGDADGLLLGTPNYHGSYAAPLKNALDYCGRDEFEATTTGLLVVAGGSSPTRALEHLRTVCRTLDAWTLPHEVAIPNSHSTVSADGIETGRIERRVRTLGEQLTEYAGVDHYPETVGTTVESNSRA